jgi:two-component sensor histidine kinase
MQGKVRFVYDIEDVFLPMDTGIPCGLILNELITNSFKYAFKDREEGVISIKLSVIEDGKFLYEIGDNGVGIDKSFDIENAKSLGLKIVNKLVQQIEGSVECDLSDGTKFIIKF